MNKKDKKRVISLKEAAEMLGLHPKTLYTWMKKYQALQDPSYGASSSSDFSYSIPPFFRVGNLYKFRFEDVEKFIEDAKE